MLLYLNFGGGGGGQPWIPLILFLLPTLYNYYMSSSQQNMGSSNVQGTPGRGTAGDGSIRSGNGGASHGFVDLTLIGFAAMAFTALLTVMLTRIVLGLRGGFPAGLRELRRLLGEALGFGGEAQGAAQAGGRRAMHTQTPTRSQRVEHVAKLMQGLPVESYRSREELERMSVAELKQLLKKRGLACEQCLEKRELVEQAVQGGNSTAAACSICYEDYETGDVLRVLPCGHRYHLECIDKWFLSSTDYSRPPDCPVCSAPLDGMPAAGHRAAS